MVARLDSFDRQERMWALEELAREARFPPVGSNVNMHMHSFHSYNGYDYSPAHVAYLSRMEGLYAAALCDFDVLDGMEEFLAAGEVTGLRSAVHLETRAFVDELAELDINSPGEPGVAYVMGAGFAGVPESGTPQARALARFRSQAEARNRELVARINEALPTIAVDYGADVLPLTPAGNATERHIIQAYVNMAEELRTEPAQRARFWAPILGRPEQAIASLLDDRPAFEEAVRSRLVKRGGLGYEPPTADTFPPAEDFMRWVRHCRAIPMVAWLDGASAGESDPARLLEIMTAQGAAAANIVPERNWNFADRETAAARQAALEAFVSACGDRSLPINIGTEMNKRGLPFVDDLNGPVLSRYRDVFLRGARIMVGHTTLLRFADLSYVDEGAEEAGPGGRDGFFESVGGLPAVTVQVAERLREAGHEGALQMIRDAVAKSSWQT
jgi:hypothetical protein